MKKISITITGILFLTLGAAACDICGCGVGNNYIGILPEFYKHIFGVRYRYNSLLTHVGVDGVTTYLTTKERYSIAELWGGWTIGSKFRLMASVPYSFNEKLNQGTSKAKNGIGDITVSGYYQLLNKRSTVLKDKLLVQSLWIGAGIKLPTGEYNPADKTTGNQNTNLFQLGTASVDYMLAAMYDIRLQDQGLNFSAAYKINSGNKYNYSYGNKFNGSVQAYRKLKMKAITFAPNVGIQFEQAQKDIDNQFEVDLSGGSLLLGTLGVETTVKKVAIGANWQTPLTQNLASGFVKANNRLMVHVSFAL